MSADQSLFTIVRPVQMSWRLLTGSFAYFAQFAIMLAEV